MTNPIATPVDGNTVVKLARGVRLQNDPVRGQAVLLAPERALALDEIAVAIVTELDGERSLDTIADIFAARFDAPKQQILSDMVTFVGEFSKRRMLEFRS